MDLLHEQISWNRALLEKLIVLKLVEKFLAFYLTLRLLVIFTGAQKLDPALGQMNLIHTIPFRFLRIDFNVILPFMPRSFKRFFPSDFPTQTVYSFLFSMPRPSHPPLSP
jgi:hypothetical protein